MDYVALGSVLGIVLLVATPIVAFVVWLALLRWSWKQRGIGLARGWFAVVDEREGRTMRLQFLPGQRARHVPSPDTSPPEAPSKPNGSGGKPQDAGHRWLGE